MCKNLFFIILSTVFLMFLYVNKDCSASPQSYTIFSIFAAFSGFVITFALSNFILHFSQLSKLVSYIGQNTIPILCFHFIGFKIVTFFY